MRLEDLAVIGNCQFSALVSRTGDIVWCCLPSFDSEPVFASILDDKTGGRFSIAPASGDVGALRHVTNTNITETVFTTADGRFRVVDFAPRFVQYDRTFRPTQLVRIVEPLEGTPRVAVSCLPTLGWSKGEPVMRRGSNHVRFDGFERELRLTTDMPLSFLNGAPFALTETKYFVLSWDAPVEEPLRPLAERYLLETTRYWQRWVKHCNIPPLFQQEVLRSALVLKLHCYEDTGAIIAAMTTSIPESPDSGRTWDYRYCWLRDAYYSLSALRLLGHFEEREKFLTFLLNVAGSAEDLALSPLYRIDGRSDLEERQIPGWAGFEGHGPVRVGNAAALQTQHDIYGEMVLALVRIFVDERFRHEQSKASLALLERLTRKAISLAGTPDAGIWEYRTEPSPQTFSSLMSWAAADRMAFVAARHLPEHEESFRAAAKKIREEIIDKAWNADLAAFVGSYGGRDLDASLMQLPVLRFLPMDDKRLHQSLDTMRRDLSVDGWLMRYRLNDGFGTPTVAFRICTFWMIEALAILGRPSEAAAAMKTAIASLSRLGLMAEDYDVVGKRMWGNFPQTYSHVGLIHAAFAASPAWSELL